MVNANTFDGKSGGAEGRDLRFRGPPLETRDTMLNQNCHLVERRRDNL
jgi:hypothetical protein